MDVIEDDGSVDDVFLRFVGVERSWYQLKTSLKQLCPKLQGEYLCSVIASTSRVKRSSLTIIMRIRRCSILYSSFLLFSSIFLF